MTAQTKDCFLILFYKKVTWYQFIHTRKQRNIVKYLNFYKHNMCNKYSVEKRSPWSHLLRHVGSELVWFSPSKARHQLALVIQIFLNLLPHVKDWTVAAAEESAETVLLNMKDCCCKTTQTLIWAVFVPGTEHILMEGSLTTLTLSPQARETLLQCVQMKDL